MSAGNFLSALVQRGVQAAGGATRGRQEGRDRLAAEARQAQEDALQRQMIESRMRTEALQQRNLDPEVQRQNAEREVTNALRRIQAQKEAQLEVERLRGQNQVRTAGVRGGGRVDPRAAAIRSEISSLQNHRNALNARRVKRNSLGPTGARLTNSQIADSNATINRAQASDDSTVVVRRNELRQIAGNIEPEEGGGAESILDTEHARQAGETDADWWERLVDGGMSEQEATAKVQSAARP